MRIVVKYRLCGVYWIEFGLKKEDALSLFHFSRALFYAVCEVKANKKELKLNGRFSFWSMVKMVAYCEETNVHISKEMKEGLSCSLVKTKI
jgi:hypothetical protein